MAGLQASDIPSPPKKQQQQKYNNKQTNTKKHHQQQQQKTTAISSKANVDPPEVLSNSKMIPLFAHTVI